MFTHHPANPPQRYHRMRRVRRAFGTRPPFVVLQCAAAIALAAPSARAQVAPAAPAGTLVAPTKLRVFQIDPTTLTLQWAVAPGATSYRLYVASGGSTGSPQIIGNAGARVTQWIVGIRPGMV